MPPRVVLFTTYYHPVIGGVETHARRLARALSQHGIPLWVLTKQTSAGPPCEETVDGVRVKRIPPSGPRTSGAKWRLVPSAIAALARARDEYDQILCIDYRAIGIAALTAARALGKSVVLQASTPGALSCEHWNPALSRAGFAPDGVVATALKTPIRAIYGSADGYACISREFEAESKRYASAAALVRYLPHTVDTTAFRPPTADERRAARASLQLPLDRHVVTFVGRLGQEKGILDLLEAWQRLDRTDALLLVVGPDMPGNALDAGPEVRARVAALPAGRVILHGPATDVRPMLAAADVFVQPSHYEAFGISVIEAMASGCAIVATRVGGMAEYLGHGLNALLSEPHDAAGLAANLATVLDAPDVRRGLQQAARESAVSEFDDARVTRAWVEFLTEAHAQKTGRQVKNSAAINP